jgi:nitroimidazol reductase NimA-like FMN-containing flavoprotein (pyridoxamine 5'-phosphate oxidase superfamily)
MRRREKEITDRGDIDQIIRGANVCRLAMTDGDQPYMVPLCFGYTGDALYFHAAPEGRKLDILGANNKVCFEFDAMGELVTADDVCHWGMTYESVIGFGTASLVTDLEERNRGLAAVVQQYGSSATDFDEAMLARTAIIRVDIESVSGKRTS